MIQSYFSRTYYLLYSETALTLYRVQGQKVAVKTEFAISSTDDFSAVLARVKQQYPLKTDDTLIVGLPLRLFNLVGFSLPRAAEENLDEAIGYELTRHIPYELGSSLFYTVSEVSGDHLRVHATLALKEALQSYLAELSAAGFSVTAIAPALLLAAWMTGRNGIYLHCPDAYAEFLVYRDGEVVVSATEELPENGEIHNLGATLSLVQNHKGGDDPILLWQPGEGSEKVLSVWPQPPEQIDIDISVGTTLPSHKELPYKINLFSAQILRKKKFKTWFKIIACTCFLLSLGFYPAAILAGKYNALNTLEQKLAVVREQAETLDALRQENQVMIERYEKLAAYIRSRPQVINILKEVTDIISKETWLTSLEMHEKRLKLQGTAAEATTVIESLANSPLFQDVHFDSPVVKKGSREAFTVVATLK